MAKYFGTIGFTETVETIPGVWEEQIVEHSYFGDITRNMSSRHQDRSGELNPDLYISNQISVLADPYAFHNFQSIRYITWMDTKWKVVSAEVQHPRLILEIGGVYNGKTGPEA